MSGLRELLMSDSHGPLGKVGQLEKSTKSERTYFDQLPYWGIFCLGVTICRVEHDKPWYQDFSVVKITRHGVSFQGTPYRSKMLTPLVLNAFRHQRKGHHRHERVDPDRVFVLNAFRHQRKGHFIGLKIT